MNFSFPRSTSIAGNHFARYFPTLQIHLHFPALRAAAWLSFRHWESAYDNKPRIFFADTRSEHYRSHLTFFHLQLLWSEKSAQMAIPGSRGHHTATFAISLFFQEN
jgi:hypothetical protein